MDQQNAQGDQSACQTIASKLVNDGDDLILAIGTPAAQAVAGSTTEIPVVGTAVTDFAAAGLVEANDAPGGNVTGTSDLNPVSDQIALLQKLVPEAKKVGILYCSAEDNSGIQADLAEKACKDAGLSTERFTVSSSNEIQQVVESMAGKVDAVYAPTDNVIAAGIATVSMVANENNLPVICGEENMVNGGGLATYSLNYRDMGYRAGEMAVKILKGEAKPADMPIEYLSGDDLKLVVNEETAKTLGIDVSGLESDLLSVPLPSRGLKTATVLPWVPGPFLSRCPWPVKGAIWLPHSSAPSTKASSGASWCWASTSRTSS